MIFLTGRTAPHEVEGRGRNAGNYLMLLGTYKGETTCLVETWFKYFCYCNFHYYTNINLYLLALLEKFVARVTEARKLRYVNHEC
jgi:hypothetical protein